MSRLKHPLLATFCLCSLTVMRAEVPANYQGKPFTDDFHKSGPPNIPGIVQCALYDLGGEGVAYHDTDTVNNGSGKLNLEAKHQRPHAGEYLWHFRKDEGVDLSFVKDFADLNHTNLVTPHINQLYIGWTADGEWVNYTVNVARPGTYRLKALYSFQTNSVTFDLNGKAAATYRLPVPTLNYHQWNYAELGTINLPEAGLQLLTFHYGKGNNFAYFVFEPVEAPVAAREGTIPGQVKRTGRIEIPADHQPDTLKALATTIDSVAARDVTVAGQVNHPGRIKIPTDHPMDVIEAITAAGDFTEFANKRNITVRRNRNGETQKYRFDQLRKSTDQSNRVMLEPGDVVTVYDTVY